MTAYLDGLRRYFDFAGRSTRSRYWLFMLVLIIMLVAAVMLDDVLGTDPTGETAIIGGGVLLLHLIPSLTVTVRRLHDINRSGWWILIGAIPLVGQIVMLVFLCTSTKPPIGSGIASAQAAPQPTLDNSPTRLDQLETLAALKASGAIDNEEFANMKSQLLRQVGP
ncbi:hypothetical protein LMIY3S_05081 [Labrys miyagiensis]